MVTHQLLTEGDLGRGHPPDRKVPLRRCSIVDPDTGAVCILPPHGDTPHHGMRRVEGTLRDFRVTMWTGGTERALVVDGYTWTVLPGTDYEVRALTAQPLALRYRPRPEGPRAPIA